MKITALAALSSALFLSACSTVEPVYTDNSQRTANTCIKGDPDQVASKFWDWQIEHPVRGLPNSQQLTALRPYLSEKLWKNLLTVSQHPNKTSLSYQGDLFSSQKEGATSADVADSSTIPNADSRHIPLRVSLSNASEKVWQDEILMVREGECWVVDDIRYLANDPHQTSGTLSQVLESY